MRSGAPWRWSLVLAGLLCACVPPIAPPEERTLSVAELLGPVESDGYLLADSHRNFSFPEDHGPHDGFRTEWWYFTGNVAAAEGRRFGYQLTFFRTALTPRPLPRQSRWAADHVFMAHFTVTDMAGAEFHSHERFSREALGLAGAQAEPLRIWLEDWIAEASADGRLVLSAAADGISIALALESGKPPVLQGDAGWSRKGRGVGNASYYYSLTRMPTSGSIRLGARSFEVSGESWMDREWSTSVLEEGQVGWDWLSLQLDDGRDLMIYQLRRADGSADPLSGGTLVASDGSYRRLAFGSWRLDPVESWTSPTSDIRYPSAWRLTIEAEELDLEIRPLIAEQELLHTFRYWEGAVVARGTISGTAAGGRGYVELTGYD